MPLLILLLVLVGIAVGVTLLGLAAEREPAVTELNRRLAGLSHPQRARLGVWIARDRRVPFVVRVFPLTAFVYWVTPLDLIPDIVPRIGYFDDRIVLALAWWSTIRLAPAGVIAEHMNRAEYLRDFEATRETEPE